MEAPVVESAARAVIERERGSLAHLRRSLVAGRLASAKSLYRRDLVHHCGCVNALDFSACGRWLASGGDDRRVSLWDVARALVGDDRRENKGDDEEEEEEDPVEEGEAPKAGGGRVVHDMRERHAANVFCVALAPSAERVYSGGYDARALVHDARTRQPVDVLPHRKSVYGVAVDAFDARILSTAGEDGRLLVFDTRQSVEESLVVCRSRRAFHAVAFHPLRRGLLAAANARNGAALWDLRKPKRPIVKYGPGASSTSSAAQNCTSVRFDSSGERLLTLRRRLPPALYRVDSPEPAALFHHPDYYNSCTVKGGCFAGDDDGYVLSGSDDFNLYLWRVPEDDGGQERGECARVDRPRMVLYGHRSIVNQVRYNRAYGVLASSGVEKIVKIWSPLPLPGATGSLADDDGSERGGRELMSAEDCAEIVLQQPHAERPSTSEDPVMMARFDSLVQREFELRRCSPDDDDGTDTLSEEDAAAAAWRPDPAERPREQPPPTRYFRGASHKDTDSSDSEQMLIHFLRKKVPNGSRSQSEQNTVARLITSRRSKLLRLAHKRFSPRYSKIQLSSISLTRANKKMRASRPLRARRGLRRGGSSPPLPSPSVLMSAPRDSSISESEPDSDAQPSTHILQRNVSKMTRLNRRRMTMPNNLRRRIRSFNHYSRVEHSESSSHTNDGFLNDDPNNDDDNLAIPSTSTGIRSHHNPALFRISQAAAADSDDDQSGGSKSPERTAQQVQQHQQQQLVSIAPSPANGSCEDLRRSQLAISTANLDRSPPNNNSNNTIASIQLDLRDWDRSTRGGGVLPTLARLRHDINESEVESCCSTRSTADDATTADDGNADSTMVFANHHHLPGGSSGQQQQQQPPLLGAEWRQRQKIKRMRRNYRSHHSKGNGNR